MGGRKKTHNEYVEQVAIIHNNIEVIGKYVDAKTSILHRCKIDSYEWLAKPNNILSGKGCPKCSKKQRRTHEEYVIEVAKINSNINVIGKYINARKPILHQCKIDNYQWIAAPTNILNGHGCPICAGYKKKTHEEYVKELADINCDIEVIGEYIDSLTPILHKCKVDGYEWTARPSALLYGEGCPKCKTSKGEKAIANWLNNKNILYDSQYTFNDCKDKNMLPFDFYLPDYNLCVEYQGKQHYEPVGYFGGEEKFCIQQRHDQIKRDYCANNNILLFEIPYFKDINKELEDLYNLIEIRDKAVGGDM